MGGTKQVISAQKVPILIISRTVRTSWDGARRLNATVVGTSRRADGRPIRRQPGRQPGDPVCTCQDCRFEEERPKEHTVALGFPFLPL